MNKVSVSGESVASMSVGTTDCHAVHGAAAYRCSAEPTPRPPIRSGGGGGGGGGGIVGR